MKTIKVKCPAKINLSLKVLGKRPDGFHDIESVMQAINLYDYLTVSVEPSEKLEIELSGTSDKIPYDEKNLVWRAAVLFFEKAGMEEFFKVSAFIEKNIPVEAGLAGGSTDGAGMLFALNELFEKPLTREGLHELCAKLGSDLNFCLEGGRKMTTGRGEKLQNLPFEEFSVSLVKPMNFGISAKEAYTKFSAKKELNALGREDFVNDLEWAVIEDYPELQKIKQAYPNAVMSGSGPTYYAIGTEFSADGNLTGGDCIIINGLKSIPDGVGVVE